MRDAVRMECPQCAIKHLSAAMAHYELARLCASDVIITPLADDSATRLARVIICLTEAMQGYKSHIPLAIGYLVLVEESLDEGRLLDRSSLRGVRLHLTDLLGMEDNEAKGKELEWAHDTLREVFVGLCEYNPGRAHKAMACAHYGEACRECSDVEDRALGEFSEWCIGAIKKLVEEYWDANAMKGGEEHGDGTAS